MTRWLIAMIFILQDASRQENAALDVLRTSGVNITESKLPLCARGRLFKAFKDCFSPFCVTGINLKAEALVLERAELEAITRVRRFDAVTFVNCSLKQGDLMDYSFVKKARKITINSDALISQQFYLLLSAAHNLEYLDLSNVSLDEANLREIATIKKLAVLKLANAKLGDRTLLAVSQNRSLTVLDLRENQISDRGMRYLLNCNSIKELLLDGNTKITTKSARVLLRMQNLRHLSVLDSGFDSDAVERLRRRRPSLEIVGP